MNRSRAPGSVAVERRFSSQYYVGTDVTSNDPCDKTSLYLGTKLEDEPVDWRDTNLRS